jgi:hypothetical protein
MTPETLRALIADPNATLADVRAAFAGVKMTKADAYALSRAMGYTPSDSAKATLARLQSNIESIKMSQWRVATILA